MRTLELSIEALERKAKQLSREERKEIADNIASDYLRRTGRSLKEEYLVRLSDVILVEELKDRHPDKVTRNEYPILSERQLLLRSEGRRREKSKTTDVVIREVPLKHASNVATDGENYTLPIRSFINPF